MQVAFGDVLLGGGSLPGVHQPWAMSDWNWDPFSMTATTRTDGPDARASKRANIGALAQGSIRMSGVTRSNTGTGSQSNMLDSKGQVWKELLSGDFNKNHSASERASGRSDPSLPDEDSQERTGLEESQELSAGRLLGSLSNMVCQVKDCGRSLAPLTMYHQRSRICEVHLKLPSFMRAGKQQRFCQQCGRCHELAAFEGTKRSCRVQLNKHNARRRRQKEKQERVKEGQGTGAGAGGGMSSRTVVPLGLESPLGTGAASSEGMGAHSILNSTTESAEAVSEKASPLPLTSSSHGPSLLGNFQGLPALPLEMEKFLTSPRPRFPAARLPSITDLLTVPLPEPAQPEELSQFDLYRKVPVGTGNRATGTPSQSLLKHVGQDMGPAGLGPRPGTIMGETTFEVAKRLMSNRSSYNQNVTPTLEPIQRSASGQDMWGPAPSGYLSEHKNLRIWFKLFNVSPADLPAGLREQIFSWLTHAPVGVTGYLKEGCVHLTVDMWVNAATHQESNEKGIRSLAEYLTAQPDAVWQEGQLLISINNQIAYVKDGGVLAIFEGHDKEPPPPSMPPLPVIQELQPRMVVGSTSYCTRFDVIGHHILCGEGQVLVRFRGRYVETKALGTEPCCPPTARECDSGLQVRTVAVAPGLSPGVAWVEVQRGAQIGPARPLLVLPEDEIAEDVELMIDCLLREGSSPAQVDDFVVDLGRVLAAQHDVDGHIGPIERNLTSKLLGMAIKAGLPDLSNYLLRVGSKGQMSAGWVVWVSQAVEQVCGTSVLHLAVQSAEPVMLDTVISWAKQNAFCWKADWQGDRGVSPLHLAVFLPDGGRTALKLAETCSPGPEAWFNTAADDGMTPAGFTSQLGMHHLNIKMTKLTSLIRSVSVHDRAEGQVVPVETCFCGEFREQSAAGSGDDGGVDAVEDSACSSRDCPTKLVARRSSSAWLPRGAYSNTPAVYFPDSASVPRVACPEPPCKVDGFKRLRQGMNEAAPEHTCKKNCSTAPAKTDAAGTAGRRDPKGAGTTGASTAPRHPDMHLPEQEPKHVVRGVEWAKAESSPLRGSSRCISSSEDDHVVFPPGVLKTAFQRALLEEDSAIDVLNSSTMNMQWQHRLRSSISPVHQPFEPSQHQLVNADA